MGTKFCEGCRIGSARAREDANAGAGRLEEWNVKRLLRSWMLVGLMIAIGAATVSAQSIGRETLTLTFGDVESVAEITYPASESGPFAAVILIPGSGVADMDHAVVSPFDFGPQGPVTLSANFRTIAETLSQHGFAVVRYNKRHVFGPNQADFTRFYQLTLDDLRADAEVVIEAAKAHPMVDGDQVYLYGWSEGSTIAAAMAAERDDIAGLVLQTPVVYPWRETFAYQALKVGWPFIMGLAEEGAITADSLMRGMTATAGMVAKSSLSYLVDASAYMTGQLAVNSLLDTDQDGRLTIGSELTMSALLELMLSAFQPGGYLAMYAPGVALPPVGDRIGAVDVPILILQGANDANVPPDGARVLYESLRRAGHHDVTLLWYADLGHSLGEAPSVEQDNFQPIADEPVSDVVEWLKERTP